jgi:hypothetical protein
VPVDLASFTLSTHRRIEPASPELGFAFGIAASIDGISFDDGDDTLQDGMRMSELRGARATDCLPSCLLIGYTARIAEAGEDEAVDNVSDLVFVAREPGKRADCARDKQKPVGVAQPECLEVRRQLSGHCDRRKIVVGERSVTYMAGKQDCVADLTWDDQLTVAEVASAKSESIMTR